MGSFILSVIGWLLGLITGKKQDQARELGRKDVQVDQARADAEVIRRTQEAAKHVDSDVASDPDNLDGVRGPDRRGM